MEDKMDVHDLPKATLERYFFAGFEYKTIVLLLERHHSVTTSVRTLRRVLSNLGLKRRGQSVDIDAVRNRMRTEMEGPGCLKGYRSMWHLLRIKHHIQVPRRYVAHLLHELDPEASRERHRRRLVRRTYFSYGPNFSWHVDGYDKLKPYGLPIHGAIDGFSRKILWLKVVHSNNSPAVPLTLFMDSVKEIGACPTLLRSDHGTENGLMAAAQCFLRREDDDIFKGENAHRYGSSPKNQRIECWWSVLRRGSSSWWIDLFQELSASGFLDLDNKLHHELSWFCFSGVLQDFLDEVKNHWNTHRIRKSRYGTVGGIPDALYSLPEEYDAMECKKIVTDFRKITDIDEFLPQENNENIYKEYVDYLASTYDLHQPHAIPDAIALFKRLVSIS